jgi:hypothetical protein
MTEKSRLCKISVKRISSVFIKAGLTLFLFPMILSCTVLAQAQTWTPTDSMGTARRHATVTRLLDGRVLVAGGNDLGATQSFATAEIYDPVTEQFTPTTGSMATPRTLHTATLLPDGRVLIAGGWDIAGTPHNLASAEIYNPASGTFSSTGSMTVSRSQHSATMLQGGTVLITAGWGVSPAPNNQSTAETFDPASGTFTATGSLSVGRNTHTATLLQDGRVLVVGGIGLIGTIQQAEIYDPSSGSFSIAGLPNSLRAAHTATLLPDGRVLIAGGNSGPPLSPLASAELYDPSSDSFSSTAGSLGTARQWHSAILLPGGNVLFAGGNENSSNHWTVSTNYLNSAELYDPTSNTFYSIAPMSSARSMVRAAVLQNGEVLVSGGGPASAELYTGLVAWYTFNGDAADQSNNGNNAAVNGATLTQDMFGNLNSAYEFDGTDDSIEAADSPSLNVGGAITLAAWIKPDLNNVTLPIVLKYQSPPSNPNHTNDQAAYWLYAWTSGAPGPRFRVDTDGLTGDTFTSDLLPTTSWSFVVGTYDGSTAKIYINGDLKGTASASGRIQLTTIPLTIGSSKYETVSPKYFDGKIDDVRIYNRALSKFEIQQIICDGLGGDLDGDGVCDDEDNCPDEINPLQENQDGDADGDACDPTAMGEDQNDKPDLAAVVAPSPDGSISVSVTVTLKALNWDGSPGIDDTFYVKPNPDNVVVRLKDSGGNEIIADQVLCGPPCSLPDDLVNITVQEGSRDFSTVIPLTEWFTNLLPADYLLEVSFTNLCDDPEKNPDGTCPLDAPSTSLELSDCFLGIWQGTQTIAVDLSLIVGSQNDVDQCPDDLNDPGEGAGNTGCEFADYNYVVLHTVTLGKGPSTKVPLSGVEVRVFDRNDPDFQAEFGKNPKGSMYGVVFEPPLLGYVGACITDANGECYVGEEQPGDYLVIARYIDSETGDTVYVGRPKSPGDFINNIAEKELQFIKVFKKNGDIIWRGGSKIVVNGSILEVIAPDSAIWEGTQSVYPFIFTSDSNWTGDVCADVPSGYSIVGVYDENGVLIPSADCMQTFVSGEAKTVAFEVQEIGSPEPYLDATLDIVGPKGKKVKKKVKVWDIRKKTFKEKLKEKKVKSKK